ncbi:P-loop NTPase fold protein [Oscillospiraceae bacterium PP1C4]
MSTILLNFKKYFGEVNQAFPLSHLFQISVLISTALMVVDILNVPTQLINSCQANLLYVLIASVILLLITWLFNLHMQDLFALAAISVLDSIIIISFFSGTLCTITIALMGEGVTYKITLSSVLSITSIAGLISRIIYHSRAIKKSQSYHNNVFDLKSVYLNDFIYKGDGPILIAEEDVDYDLLMRNGLINRLYSAIRSCKPGKSFVIGLEGDWGSGKTTILNNVKAKLNATNGPEHQLVIIDEFNPWIFGTQESLLLAMFDSILKHSGMKYSVFRSQKMLEELIEVVTGNYAAGGIIKGLSLTASKRLDQINRIKNRINSYLQTNNKAIVFFIDNIDRAEASNIIFLFKLIGTIFDLQRVVYVLSYDRKRVAGILQNTLEIDQHYIEKVIQQEIKVPAIHQEQLEIVYSTFIKNILGSYGVNPEEMKRYIPIEKCIFSQVTDLRKFKRLINSAFSVPFCDGNTLYKRDLLAIAVVHFVNPDLYDAIYSNRKFFISHDQIHDMRVWGASFNNESFNKEGKAFYDQLFSTVDKDYIELLAELFPYVKRYCAHQELQYTYAYSDPEYDNIAKKSRICSAKYFDLYFSYGTNDYLIIGKGIAEFIGAIDHSGTYISINELINSKILSLPKAQHKEWFERLQNFLDEIVDIKKYLVGKALFANIYQIDSSGEFFGLNAQSRVEVIIALVLEECTDENFEDFVTSICHDYLKLKPINSVIYWLEHSKSENKSDVTLRKERLEKAYQAMCTDITQKQINLYSDRYYHIRNIWSLYSFYESSSTDVVKKYINGIISASSIYRILGDLVSQSMGDGYSYSIADKNFSLLFEDCVNVDILIQENPPRNDSEVFVQKVYQEYKTGTPDVWGDKSLSSFSEIRLDL